MRTRPKPEREPQVSTTINMRLRKPRRDQSKVGQLPPDQQAQVRQMVLSDMTYAQMSEQIKERFGLSISHEALCNFRQRLLNERMKRQPCLVKLELTLEVAVEDSQLGVRLREARMI